jgi:pimeloyl-ACP methyl ester carboxylesterase
VHFPKRTFIALGAVLMALLPAQAFGQDGGEVPIVFVHGNSGSAQQFETNAMRFTSNGFPQDRLFAYEYDTSVPNNVSAVEGLDGYLAEVKRRTGATQVDVLAHSRGTLVMHTYLASPERAANVRNYVNFDGRPSDSQPGGVRTLAIWGEGDQTRAIGGAQNLYFPNRAHTEVTTSAASFAAVYEFLNGERPETKKVVPENPKRVRVAGRALAFPANVGIDGGQLAVYEVKASTGQRVSEEPVYEKAIDPLGFFGPFKVNGRKHYELAVTTPAGYTIHNYTEPFERDDYFYRVLDAPALRPFIEQSPNHVSIAVTRMREWWGDQEDPKGNDGLSFDGLDVMNAAIAPRRRRILAVFNFDKNSDGQTDTSASLSPFNAIGFLTGVDNYMAASPDASGSIRVRETMRGNRKHVETINVPNWPSSTDTVSVYFRDYVAKEYKAK